MSDSTHSGAGAVEIKKSKWKFFTSLRFPEDGFTPRATVSNMNVYEITNPPPRKTSKLAQNQNQQEARQVMQSAAASLEKLTAVEPAQKTEDQMFGDLLAKVLQGIPECEEQGYAKNGGSATNLNKKAPDNTSYHKYPRYRFVIFR